MSIQYVPKFIPVNDSELLRASGCPYKRSTLYRFRCQGIYPKLFIKIGSRLCLDVAAMEKMARKPG